MLSGVRKIRSEMNISPAKAIPLLLADGDANDRARVAKFINELDSMTWPELIIVGGGASSKAHLWLPFVTVRPQIVPARFRRRPGCRGAHRRPRQGDARRPFAPARCAGPRTWE